MPNLGPLEIVTIAVVALIVFGPRRLPEIARTVGRAVNELRRMASDVRSEFDTGFGLEDDDDEVAVGDDDTPTADGVAEPGAARPPKPAPATTADGIAAAGRAAAARRADPEAADPEPSPAEVVTADGVVTADAEADPDPDDDAGGDAPGTPAP